LTGGRGRSIAPRELARDPEAWPEAGIDDGAAAVVQHIARTLKQELADRGMSLRTMAGLTGVNRQTATLLIDGLSWPDVLTVCRLEDGLRIALWPGAVAPGSSHVEGEPLRCVASEPGFRGIRA
jgi:hypothetical protein